MCYAWLLVYSIDKTATTATHLPLILPHCVEMPIDTQAAPQQWPPQGKSGQLESSAAYVTR